MGNSTSKQKQDTEKPLDVKEHLSDAVKNLVGEQKWAAVMKFLNSPQEMLTNITLPPKFKRLLATGGAFATGVVVTTGITGGHLLHLKHLGLAVVKGMCMASWLSVISYVALAANIATIAVQIHYIYKTSQVLEKNTKYLGTVNKEIERIKTEVVKLLARCNEQQWEDLAKPDGMNQINKLLEDIVNIQAELNLRILELEREKSFMRNLAIGSAGLSLLTIIGGACILGLAATGIGSFILLGAVIATGVAVGIGAAVSGYYAYQCDKQLKDFRKAKAKLDVLSATLRSIRENIKTKNMKPNDVKQWLLKRGLRSLDEDSKQALDVLRQERYLVVDIIRDFKEEKFVQSVAKYNLKENVTRLLVKYLQEFQTKIISGEKLLGKFVDYEELLKKWKLEQYVTNFSDNGYEEVEEWKEITIDELKEIGMKIGHARKFMRLKEKHFESYQPKE